MAKLSKTDIPTFLNLFNRGGYVLNFSTYAFDTFTKNSIGIPLCGKYNLSKGASLEAYLYEAPSDKAYKLLVDLLGYYENNYEGEYAADSDQHSPNGPRRNAKYASLYKKCRTILDEAENKQPLSNDSFEELKEDFSSEYISKQIDAMKAAQVTNPTDAIGKAKELVESCCKTILERCGDADYKNLKLSKLADKTLNRLRLTPSCVAPNEPAEKSIKALLGNLESIVASLSEIRNIYGGGHGKPASFIGLETRHAKLAVNSCVAFVTFVWESYETCETDGAPKTNN